MRLLLVLPVLLAACGPLPDGGAAQSVIAPRPGAPLLDRVPFQRWPARPARTVGLLVQYDSPYGALISWTRTPRRLGPEPWPPSANARYCFLADGASPWAMYFTSKGEGHNYMPHWSVPTLRDGGRTFKGVAMHEPGRNPFGLRAPAHLVEVEVNGGRGAPPGLHFVATDVQVLDGSSAYPIVVDDALTEARRRYDHELRAGRREPARALAAAARSAPAPFGPERTVEWEGVFPTWLQDARRLRVFFYRAIIVTSTKTEMETFTPRGPLLPRGGPRRPGLVTRVRGHGVERGLEVEFDDHGRVLEERIYAPAPMTRAALERPGVRVE